MKLVARVSRNSAGTYRAWCPALPGCVVWGQSRQEAEENINRAVFGYLASLNVALPRELSRIAQIA